MTNKILLALDQSTTATGWAIFKQDQLKDFGVFSPSGDRDARIHKTKLWLQDQIHTLSDEGNVTLAFEDIQMQANVETFKSLAQLQGVIINTAFQEKKEKRLGEYLIYFSSAWKSTCGVKGRRRKEQKQNAHKFVLNTYGVDAPEDACDAICLGHHHLANTIEEINFE